MNIKDPKFKEGQKVLDIKYKTIYSVVCINNYSFIENEYVYDVVDNANTYIYMMEESTLAPYVE